LRRTAQLAAQNRARVVNVDAALIAEAPKIAPHIEQMRARIAAALGILASCVGIKATTNEQLGFIGRGEGIAAMATASVEQDEI
jgi:2-C-methyl-D-erythritol 2,4-cyclodiphosphate synthase